MENIIKDRSKNEYTCALGPKLLLIALKPLDNDKKEIFDSVKGMDYLSHCFKSKFKSAETHVTYLLDENSKLLQNGFYNIFEYYHKKGTFDPKQFMIGFIGQQAFEEFKHESDSLVFDGICSVGLREITSSIRIYVSGINNNKDFYAPYIILPDTNEDFCEVSNILNDTKMAQNISSSPYSSTKEVINHFKLLVEKYKAGDIKGFRFNSKINFDLPRPKTEYFKVYDYGTTHELVYCPSDVICENDTAELKSEFKASLIELFKTVPICGDDIENTLSLYKFSGHEQIRIVEEKDIIPDPYEIVLDRPYFKVVGSRNGTPSDWYTKWRNEVFYGLNLDKKTIKREGYDDSFKYEWIYDIEVFKNDWLFVAKSMDGESKVICWNDPINLAKWIKNKILIGFNNAGYDDAVIHHALVYPYAVKGALTVKEFSDLMIYDELDNTKRRPEIREEFKNQRLVFDPPFLSWDVSFHMPFDIRRNSLKKLTMSVLNRRNYDSNVPFDTPRPLTQEERREVERYCEMDVDNTRDLFLPDPEDIKKKEENPKYKMREFARDSYDIKWNLMVEYKMTAKTLITKSSSFAGKVLCGEDAKPNPKNTFKLVDGKRQYYLIPDMAYTELKGSPVLDFYIKHQDDPNYIKEKFEYYMGGDDESHKYQFGFGGLHQALINFGSTNLCNFDVASLYPSLLIQYNLMSRGAEKNPDSYKEVYHTRIAAKHEGKTLLNLGLKLVLNGAIGAMLSNYNPLYDTWSNSSICVHGQLLLFILCKRLYEAGFNIVQTNTDGIMVERREDVDFMPICKKWEEETRLVLEYDDIAILQQNNVNNYYCQFTNGKVKSKGFYLSNEKYGKATSIILCNMVTGKPLLEGTQPRDYVIYKRHSIGEIYDGVTNQKLEGRSLAFVVGYPEDPRTQSYYSRSRNEREVVKKDENGKAVVDENGNNVTETVNSISKINGFTEHMLLVDDTNTLTFDEINTKEYINFAKNLLDKKEVFGPYYNENFVKIDEPSFLQALNPLKDNTDEHPTKSGVVCQNFLFECDYLSREEQEELIKPIEKYTYRIVWSGSRSYHIVIRLNKPVTSTSYKKVWYYLQYRLGLEGADEQANLPSKYTRVPDQINPKTGNMQELYSENKYIFDLDEILENMPRLKDELKRPTQYKGKVDMKALERHIKRLNFQEGSRFEACQKLSPVLISQVTLEELIKMIPIKLEKDHINVLRAKYYYFEKYKDLLTTDNETPLDETGEV